MQIPQGNGEEILRHPSLFGLYDLLNGFGEIAVASQWRWLNLQEALVVYVLRFCIHSWNMARG